MTKKFHAASWALVAAATFSGECRALDPQGYKTAEDLVVTPQLQVSERWDDNFRAVETGAESSFVTTVAPGVTFAKKGRTAEFSLGFNLSHDIFHSSHSDDNTDGGANGMLAVDLDRRNRLRLDAGFNHVEETASLVQNLQSDVSETTTAGALYGYGAETARGQFELGASINQLRFKNDLVLPSGALLNADRERDAAIVKGILYVALAPRTKTLVEVRRTAFSYLTNTGLDSTNTALLAGVKWEASAITSGSIKVGAEKKAFDKASIGDKSNSMWEVAVTWAPLTYSTVTLTSNSRLDEGSNGAFVIETRSLALNWEHQWLKRLKSTVSLDSTSQDYLGAPVPGGADRADEIRNAGVGLTYNMRRWLDAGVGYKFSQNDSNSPGRSYERNMFALSMTASM